MHEVAVAAVLAAGLLILAAPRLACQSEYNTLNLLQQYSVTSACCVHEYFHAMEIVFSVFAQNFPQNVVLIPSCWTR
jgi:hypothetical protein